jgi:hypothetical protein
MLKKIPTYQIVIILAAVILIAMTIYPPWAVSLQVNNRTMSQPYGWGWLLSPPESPDATVPFDYLDSVRKANAGDFSSSRERPWTSRNLTVHINFQILLLEYFVVILLAAIIAWPLYRHESKKQHS